MFLNGFTSRNHIRTCADMCITKIYTKTKFIIQILIVVPACIWWLLFLLSSNFRNEFSVKWGALFIFIYCLPNVGTNSDPRMGLPLVIIYIMSSINFIFKNKEIYHGEEKTP